MESQGLKTMKEEQDDGSPPAPSVIDIKLEPVDEDVKDFGSLEYENKYDTIDDTVETKVSVESISVLMKTERDSEHMSQETVKEEILAPMQTTEDMESSGCAVKGEVDDAEALMDPLFVLVNGEPCSEGTSEENAMDGNFEDIQNLERNEYGVKTHIDETESSVDPLSVPIEDDRDVEGISEDTIIVLKLEAMETSENLERNEYGVKTHIDETESSVDPLSVPIEDDRDVEGISEDTIIVLKLEAMETSENLERNEYGVKTHIDETESSVDPLSVPIEDDRDVEGISEDTIIVLILEAMETSENLERNEYGVKTHIDETESSVDPLSVPIEDDRDVEGISEDTIIVLKLEAMETSEVSTESIPSNPEAKSSAAETHQGRYSHGLHRHVVHSEATPCVEKEVGEGYGEQDNNQLEDHKRRHSGDKPFQCALCNKPCTTKGNLVQHMKVHSEERPYICHICGKSFKSDLKKHMRCHTGEKPYRCSQCGKTFSNGFSHTIHMRVHTRERPYKCTECSRAFSQSSNLLTHMRTHSGEKPYSCPRCGKAFSRSTRLIIHERVHSGERPYACNDCEKRFITSSNLRTHRVRVHGAAAPVSSSNA